VNELYRKAAKAEFLILIDFTALTLEGMLYAKYDS
jgi:hypothetical protein